MPNVLFIKLKTHNQKVEILFQYKRMHLFAFVVDQAQ